MSRIIPTRYINPHVLSGVRARAYAAKLVRFIGQPCPYCGIPMGAGMAARYRVEITRCL